MVWWASVRWYSASLDSERGDCHLKLVSTPTGKLSYQEKGTSLKATVVTFRTVWYASIAASIFFFCLKAETWSCHWQKNHTRRFLRTEVYCKFWCSTLCARTCLRTWWVTSSRYYLAWLWSALCISFRLKRYKTGNISLSYSVFNVFSLEKEKSQKPYCTLFRYLAAFFSLYFSFSIFTIFDLWDISKFSITKGKSLQYTNWTSWVFKLGMRGNGTK